MKLVRIKNLLKLAIPVAFGWGLLCGCATSNKLVPKSLLEIRDPQGKTYRLELPKDMTADKISLSRDKDGMPVFEIIEIKVRTNPDVIGAAGVAQSDAIEATGKVFEKAYQMGLDATKKSLTP